MNTPIEISREEAKNLVIRSQNLDTNQDTLQAIQQLGYVQIDTLSVTERSHHHVLYSRNPSYKKEELQKLMHDKKIFEYWSHAAAFLPIEHYRFSLIRKSKFLDGEHHWFKKDEKCMQYILDRIQAEGPLQSRDFKADTPTKGNWYTGEPIRNALQQLFMEGRLMIKERVNFQKVYDITQRVLPDDINTSMPTQEEYFKHLIDTTISAQGLAKIEEIGYLQKGIKKDLQIYLNELLENREIIQIKVGDKLYYSGANAIQLIEKISHPKLHILNPFDNVVIQRKRLKNLFDFDYTIECYVPEKKRKYGYYILPILWGNEFIGRIDAKADRKTRVFTVKNIWLEDDVTLTPKLKKELTSEFDSFAHFCGCREVVGVDFKKIK